MTSKLIQIGMTVINLSNVLTVSPVQMPAGLALSFVMTGGEELLLHNEEAIAAWEYFKRNATVIEVPNEQKSPLSGQRSV